MILVLYSALSHIITQERVHACFHSHFPSRCPIEALRSTIFQVPVLNHSLPSCTAFPLGIFILDVLLIQLGRRLASL